MKVFQLKKTGIVIFLSMIFFLCMRTPVLAADINTTVKIPVEQTFDNNGYADAAKEFSYILVADDVQSPMPDGCNGKSYTWTMKGNVSIELTLNVRQTGTYHYKLYQITEKKDGYTYDSKSYDVTIDGFYNSNHELTSVTVVKNLNGEKVSDITFSNSYAGKGKSNPSSPISKSSIHNALSVKTGDDSPIKGYCLLFLGSSLCLCGLLIERQRKRKGDANNEA